MQSDRIKFLFRAEPFGETFATHKRIQNLIYNLNCVPNGVYPGCILKLEYSYGVLKVSFVSQKILSGNILANLKGRLDLSKKPVIVE